MNGIINMAQRFCVALGVAAVIAASGPTIANASDHYVKEASELLSAAKTFDDIKRIIRDNPGNPALRVLGVFMPIQEETRRRVQQLFAQLEDQDVPELGAFVKADLPGLRRIEAGLQRTKANVRFAGPQIDRIYEDQIRKFREAARKLASEREIGASVTRFENTSRREIETLKRFLAAHSDLYSALHEQVLFLIGANGRYSFNATAQGVVFQNKEELSTYNGSVDRIVAAARRYEAVQREIAELTEYRPPKLQ